MTEKEIPFFPFNSFLGIGAHFGCHADFETLPQLQGNVIFPFQDKTLR